MGDGNNVKPVIVMAVQLMKPLCSHLKLVNLVACKLHLDKAVFTKGAVNGTLEVHRRELLDLVQLRLINANTQVSPRERKGCHHFLL